MTIPNAISSLRIALVPVFLWLLLARDAPAAAGWLLAGLGATDWIDGYLARRLGQVSEIGRILDPLADRLAVGAAIVGGWVSGALPWPIAAAIAGREVVVGAGAVLLAVRSRTTLEVRWIGKAGTFLLYAAIATFFVYAGWGGAIYRWAAWLAVIPGLVLYYAAAVAYVGDMLHALRGTEPVSSGEPQPGGDR